MNFMSCRESDQEMSAADFYGRVSDQAMEDGVKKGRVGLNSGNIT